jgi:Pectic acid lyase
MRRICLLLAALIFIQVSPLADEALREEARKGLKEATRYLRSISTKGGYVGIWSPDLKKRFGEAHREKAHPGEIWVQPPGTPTLGETFLRAYKATGDDLYLKAARDVGRALAWGQRISGGWDHRVNVSHLKPKATTVIRKKGGCTFDDAITQGALTFLVHLDEVIDEPWLDETVGLGFSHVLNAQYKNGGWPQWYPLRGGYANHYTFNDAAMNSTIRVLLLGHEKYGRGAYLDSAKRGGDFIILSQYKKPQRGWAQQYDMKVQPAWARAFEPPAICSAVTSRNINTLIDLCLYTGDDKYLRPIPAAIDWLERSKIGEKKWARYYEMGTNRPIYGDRDRKIHYTLAEISRERRKGYSWQANYCSGAIARYETLMQSGAKTYSRPTPVPQTPVQRNEKALTLAPKVRSVLKSQDKKGRWIRKGWLTSNYFVRNMNVLSSYLELSNTSE